MLGQAVAWRPGEAALDADAVLATPELAHYLDGWPRAEDFGLVFAERDPIGAAWWRQFRAEEPGYGYVAEDVPEVAIAVRAQWRGRGIGTSLLQALIESAASRDVRALSLTVERANPARHLYERLGFTTVGPIGNAITMALDL